MGWTPPGPAFLFCPADRPERFAKAAAVADVVIVDLEDGVTAERREQARQDVAAAHLNPTSTIVRVNPVNSPEHERDMAMLRDTGLRIVMLAKTSSADEVRSLGDFGVIALCETPAGVNAIEQIVQCPEVLGVMWGAEDLVASLGGYSSRHDDGTFRDLGQYARARTLIAAGTRGHCALDAVFLDIADLEGQRHQALDAAAMGFSGSPCVHPSQVAVVREAYRPSAAQIAWAQGIIEATGGRGGVFRVGDQMVDEPVIAQARRILARSSA